jgi:hypothetical protein
MLSLTMNVRKCVRYGRFVLAALLVVTFCAMHPAATAYAKKRKKANHGTIKIQSNPAGFPLAVDGKAYGVTTAGYTTIEGLEPGLHRVVVTLPDGQLWTRDIDLPAGRIKCIFVSYRPAPRLVRLPCPFPVKVSAPSQVSEGSVITYAGNISYGGTAGLIYTWTISPANAQIISGSGTPSITVDSTGLAGKRITATLVVDDGSGEALCRQTAQASTFIPSPLKRDIVSREFDVCRNCSNDDQKARLDNLAVELQNDPSTRTYVIAYGGRTSAVGQADRLLARARDYLVTQRGIDASRIVIINGGFREQDNVELWIVPQGATPPQPTPTLQEGDVRPASGGLRKRP